MAKLAASEAATAISHQVSSGPMEVALSPAAPLLRLSPCPVFPQLWWTSPS